MIHNDRVYGKPLILYRDTKANIEALTGLGEGSIAYATDTNRFGSFDGSSWAWGGSGQYRQFLVDVVDGDLTFLTDVDGNPIMVLLDLE